MVIAIRNITVAWPMHFQVRIDIKSPDGRTYFAGPGGIFHSAPGKDPYFYIHAVNITGFVPVLHRNSSSGVDGPYEVDVTLLIKNCTTNGTYLSYARGWAGTSFFMAPGGRQVDVRESAKGCDYPSSAWGVKDVVADGTCGVMESLEARTECGFYEPFAEELAKNASDRVERAIRCPFDVENSSSLLPWTECMSESAASKVQIGGFATAIALILVLGLLV
jgi:hypothetical protein